jgi:plastocyanin
MPLASGSHGWDGRSYWATGAIAPSQVREIPLAEDITKGDHVLTCALHPGLRVVLRVGGDAAERKTRRVAVQNARAAIKAEESGSDVTVTAGFPVADAYVGAFSPRTVRIPVGGSVTWRAGARTPVDVVFGSAGALSLAHTVPPDGYPVGTAHAWDGRGTLRSGFLSADATAGAASKEWTVTFTQPGTYPYASRFGRSMTGTVVVAG